MLKLDNYLVSKEKGKQMLEHFTKPFSINALMVTMSALEHWLALWWEELEETESWEVLPQDICRLQGSGWTHFSLADSWPTWVQLSG